MLIDLVDVTTGVTKAFRLRTERYFFTGDLKCKLFALSALLRYVIIVDNNPLARAPNQKLKSAYYKYSISFSY